MENLEIKRTLTNEEVKKIHLYGFKIILFHTCFLVMSIMALVVAILSVIHYLYTGEGNLILILLSILIFLGIAIFFVYFIINYISYTRVEIGEKVYKIKGKLYYKELGRSGTVSYIDSQPVDILSEFLKKIKNLNYGTSVEAEVIKGRKKYLLIKI